MFWDTVTKSFLIVPTSQLDIFYAVSKEEGLNGEINRLIEDDDLEFLHAVGSILI